MAKIHLTLDSDDFDNILDVLGLEVDVKQEKVKEMIAKSFDLEAMLIAQIRNIFISEGTTYNGDKYKGLTPEIKKLIYNELKPHIKNSVGNYVRTENHTCQKLIDSSVKKHIEEGIENGIRHYAKTLSEKLGRAMVVCDDEERRYEIT